MAYVVWLGGSIGLLLVLWENFPETCQGVARFVGRFFTPMVRVNFDERDATTTEGLGPYWTVDIGVKEPPPSSTPLSRSLDQVVEKLGARLANWPDELFKRHIEESPSLITKTAPSMTWTSKKVIKRYRKRKKRK